MINDYNIKDWESIKTQSSEMEFDWIGIDMSGKLALFSSFNVGFVPSNVTKSLKSYRELAIKINNLPSICAGEILLSDGGDYSFFQEYSEKGLICYDNMDVHREKNLNRYDLISIPRKPLTVYQAELESCLEIIPVFDLHFNSHITFSDLEKKLVNRGSFKN